MASLTTLKINSYIFISLMFLVFGVFIAIVGFILDLPLIVMAFIFLLVVLFQIMISSSVVKWTTGTRLLEEGDNPYLEEKVRNLAERAGIPMPKLGMVDDLTPNAFVFGLTQGGSTLSVHKGLLNQLNDDEITAVLGHEIGHIKNRDCMYMTILSTMPLIAYYGMHLIFFGGGSRRDSGAAPIVIIAIVSAIIYFITSLLNKRISRIREFYADAYSAHITKDPRSLSSALTKITYGLSLAPPEQKAKNAARSFYIGDVQNAHSEMDIIMRNKNRYDLDGDGVIDENELEQAMQDEANRSTWDRFGGLLSTHPPTFKRILALKEMEKEFKTGQVSDEKIYKKVKF
mgnify:FL=1